MNQPIIAPWDPADADVGLKAAVERYLQEKEELEALADDYARGEAAEYAYLRETADEP